VPQGGLTWSLGTIYAVLSLVVKRGIF